jgi:hypothetical protein
MSDKSFPRTRRIRTEHSERASSAAESRTRNKLADATVEAILAEAEVALARYAIADGSMRFEVAAHIATAQSPAEPTRAR